MMQNQTTRSLVHRLGICILPLCFMLVFGDAHAQNFQWGYGFGSSETGEFGVSVTSQGDFVYMTGSFRNSIDFDPGPKTKFLTAQRYGDIYITKFTLTGDLVWAKQVLGTNEERGLSIRTDAKGNVYVSGYFSGSCDFDPGPGISILRSSSFDPFILKLTADGDYVWAKAFLSRSSSTNRSMSIDVDSDGSICMTGCFAAALDFDPGPDSTILTPRGSNDIFVSKLDSSGTFMWAKSLGGIGADWGISLRFDSKHNVCVGGFFSDSVDFDPSPSTSYTLSSKGLDDAFVLKLNPKGEFLQAFSFGSSGSDYINAIAVDPSDNISFTGTFGGATDFDPGPGVFKLSPLEGSDAFIAKVHSDMTFMWAKSLGAYAYAEGQAIECDASGNVFTSGLFADSADFDPGPGSHMISSNGWNDVFISKLDSSGSYVWSKTFGGPGYDVSNGLCLSRDGGFVVSGNFDDSLKFNPPTGSYIYSKGGADIFIAKFGQLPDDVPEDVAPTDLTVRPNPAHHSIVLTGLSAESQRVIIANVLGQIVFEQPCLGEPSLNINTTGFADGAYQIYIEGAPSRRFINLYILH